MGSTVLVRQRNIGVNRLRFKRNGGLLFRGYRRKGASLQGDGTKSKLHPEDPT